MNKPAVLILFLASVVVCVAAVYVAWRQAGAIGAAFMSFGVVLMVLLSAVAVWFRIYYEKRHPGAGAPPRGPTDTP